MPSTIRWADGYRQGLEGLLEPLAGLATECVGSGQPLAIAEQGGEAVGLWIRASVGGCRGDLRDDGGGDQLLGAAVGGRELVRSSLFQPWNGV